MLPAFYNTKVRPAWILMTETAFLMALDVDDTHLMFLFFSFDRLDALKSLDFARLEASR
jgi:hypothetical protein